MLLRKVAQLGTSARCLALVLLLLLASPAGALAHAVLQGASPAADSVSARAPTQIALTFNEPVQLLALRLLDAAGRDRSPPNAPEVRDGRVTWEMQDHLADGRYLVSWRVSSLDGHVIGGSFTFAVGAAGTAPPSPAAGDDTHWPVLALHALARLTLLFAVGTALFRLLLSPASLDATLRGRTRWLAIAGLVAGLLFIGADGALRAGLPLSGVVSTEAWRAAIAAPSLVWRGCSLTGLVLLVIGGGPLRQWLGVALSLIGMADSGHALAALPPSVGQGLMILHGLTAALWIGAIAPLRLALRRDEGNVAADLFRRFQTYGALAMAGTLASGIVLALALLPRVADLWQSDYGLRLCAKLAAVAVMLGIAAANRLWLTKRALAAGSGARRTLRLVLGLDLVAAGFATVLAVGLSLGPPPMKALSLTVANDRYDATLSLAPGKVGDNDLMIALTPKGGAPAEPKEVEVRLSAPGIETIARKAARIADGRYDVRDLPLWVAGPWQVEIGLLIDDFTKKQLRAEFMLAR